MSGFPWSSIVADEAATARCSLSDEVLYTPSWAILAAFICARGRVSAGMIERVRERGRKREREREMSESCLPSERERKISMPGRASHVMG